MLQQTSEWLNFRKDKIGASDAPVIMGVSPFKTPYELWLEKIGYRELKPMTAAMQRGIDLEDKARKEFRKMTGLKVIPNVLTHHKYDWMIASLDGMCTSKKHIVEIKCLGKADHELAVSGKVPDKYYPQLQHQLEVSGLHMAYYFSFDGEHGAIVEVERDNEYIAKLIEKEKEFYDHMMNFNPPDMSERDYIYIDDQDWNSLALQWKQTSEELRELEKKEEKLRSELINYSGNRNCMGSGIRLSKYFRKGNIDYKSIPQLRYIDLEIYRKSPVESWRISVM